MSREGSHGENKGQPQVVFYNRFRDSLVKRLTQKCRSINQ